MNDGLGRNRRWVVRYWPVLLTGLILSLVSGCAILPMSNDNIAPVASVAKDDDLALPARVPVKPKDAVDDMVIIMLGDTITVNGSGASVDGSVVTITESGIYSISGALGNGQIIVNTRDKRMVWLVLNGVDITSTSSAPIYIAQGKNVTIVLGDGTENRVADGNSYDIENLEADEPNAAIFSKGNLTFAGNGFLTVEANYRHAIASKDELNITSGSITVNAVSDGIRGRDNIVIDGGNITVRAQSDGLQSNNDEDPERGFIVIEGGTINITAGGDGIQAETSVVARGGTITVTSGGGSADTVTSQRVPPVSAKGIKAVSDLRIEGGAIWVDAFDDAVHSNDRITIDGGNIVLASGDDAIHADGTLTINGGEIEVTKSVEALESAVITINDGNIRLVASDDGLNVADPNNQDSTNRRPGRDSLSSSIDKHLAIKGGYIVVDAIGDGIDINGWIEMTGGTLIINGPIVSFNGALDYEREFTITGGTLLAVGSVGMVQAPGPGSFQYSFVLNLPSPQRAGTLIHIEADDGAEILTFAPKREYQSVIYSSPSLRKGSKYHAYVGGSSTGSVVDGVYSGGSYTPGTRSGEFTISSLVRPEKKIGEVLSSSAWVQGGIH